MYIADDHNFALDAEQVWLSLEYTFCLAYDFKEARLRQQASRKLKVFYQFSVWRIRLLARALIHGKHSAHR